MKRLVYANIDEVFADDPSFDLVIVDDAEIDGSLLESTQDVFMFNRVPYWTCECVQGIAHVQWKLTRMRDGSEWPCLVVSLRLRSGVSGPNVAPVLCKTAKKLQNLAGVNKTDVEGAIRRAGWKIKP